MSAEGPPQSAVAWPGLLTPSVLAEFHQQLEGAVWQPRCSAGGSVDMLAPARHGALTGKICDYFSHPRLIRELDLITGLSLSHFLGNVVRISSPGGFSWSHQEFPVAMAVNLSAPRALGWDLKPGDGRILDLRQARRHSLPPQQAPQTLIEGYFV